MCLKLKRHQTGSAGTTLELPKVWWCIVLVGTLLSSSGDDHLLISKPGGRMSLLSA